MSKDNTKINFEQIPRRILIFLLTVLDGFLKGSKEGGERLRGCAGDG